MQHLSRVSGALGLLVTAVALIGCANRGTETGNAMGVTMQALSSANPGGTAPEGSDTQGTVFTVSTAYTYVNALEFDLPEGTTCADFDPNYFDAPVFCEEEDGDDGFRIEGPYVIDLITGMSTPGLRGLTIPEASYTRVDVGLEPSVSGGPPVPADLLAHTLYLAGTFSYAGNPATFSATLDFTDSTRFQDVTGVVGRDVLLALDVVDWFSTLPITDCLDDGDLVINAGELVIADSGGLCASIETDLQNAIRGSGELDEENEGPGGD